MYFDQNEYSVRFEWGLNGLQALASVSDVMIIVDVLSFTTCVDIITGNDGTVFPYRGTEAAAADFANAVDAVLASRRQSDAAYSLAPSSLLKAPKGTRLVLPSPNGATLSLATEGVATVAGCLRNAKAVAVRASQLGQRISVIAAGERWQQERLLRPSLEDLLGAGAIIRHLPGSRSPEAAMAMAGFANAEADLLDNLMRCGSGKELVGRGFAEDVRLAAHLNISDAVPFLVDRAYINYPKRVG